METDYTKTVSWVMTDKQNILNKAGELFLKYGYSKVTTDEIAGFAGISKKTLYNHFTTKEALLVSVIDDIFNTLESELQSVLSSEENFKDKLRLIINASSKALSRLNHHFLQDVQIKMPYVWDDLVRKKESLVKKYFGQMLEEGRKKGLVRTDINHDVVMLMLQISVEHLFDPQYILTLPKNMYPDIPADNQQIFDNIIKILFNGFFIKDAKELN